MHISDKEIRDSYSIRRTEGNLVHIAFLVDYPLEEYNYRAAYLFADDIKKILESAPNEKFCGIIDMSHVSGSIGYLSKRTREVYANIIDNERIEKIAFFGENKYYEVAINFMISLTKRRDKTKMFATEEEAIKWIRS